MALNEQTITGTTYKLINGSKELTVPATKKICIMVDGVEDADLSYTVASAKTGTFKIVMQGKEE